MTFTCPMKAAWRGPTTASPSLEGDYSSARPHAKAMLVPFGEYIPMRETFPFLEKAFEASAGTAMGMNYTPGASSSPVPVPMAPGELRHGRSLRWFALRT